MNKEEMRRMIYETKEIEYGSIDHMYLMGYIHAIERPGFPLSSLIWTSGSRKEAYEKGWRDGLGDKDSDQC
jgi:hypothetical protein